MKKYQSAVFIIFIILFLSNNPIILAQKQDSTLIRKTVKIKKTVSQKILSVPQFILKLPLKALEYTTKGTVIKVVDEPLGHKIYTALSGVDRIWGFYPVAGYGSNSGLKGGLGFRSKGLFTKDEELKIKGSYSTNKYQSYKIRYIAPNFFQSNNGITFLLYYQKRLRESFYGLGNNSLENNEAAFTLEKTYFKMGSLWNIKKNLEINLTGSYQAINLYDGTDPSLESNLDKIKTQLSLSQADIDPSRIWSINAVFKHDTRNLKGHPTKGGVEILSFSYSNGNFNILYK